MVIFLEESGFEVGELEELLTEVVFQLFNMAEGLHCLRKFVARGCSGRGIGVSSLREKNADAAAARTLHQRSRRG